MIPKYIKLKNTINEEILLDKYPLFTKLPTEIELSDLYNVSRSTVRQALDILESEGIIEKKWGSGNIVVSKSNLSKKNTVAIIIPKKKNLELETSLDDCISTLMKENFKVEIFESHNKFSVERKLLSNLLEDIYGGLIILPACSALPSCNTDLMQKLLKRATPIVFLENSPSAIYNATIVSHDSYDRGYQMARQLINLGNQNLGGIFLRDSAASVAAYNGFIDAIRDANFSICDDCYGWISSYDSVSDSSRSNGSIEFFLKHACQTATAIYLDDSSLVINSNYPIFTANLIPAKSIGKEAAKALLITKRDGAAKSLTISYKIF